MSKFQNSLIETAIVELSQSNSTVNAAVSHLVLRTDGATILNQIAGAFVGTREKRRNLKRMDEIDNHNRAKEMDVKPEHFPRYIQAVMNKICWLARGLYLQSREQEQDDQLNGMDFTADRMEDMGIEPCAAEHIGEHVEQDFAWLLNLHTQLCGRLSYLDDLEDLYVYADRAPIPDEELATEREYPVWELRASAMTFDEALDIMERVITELQEQEEAAERGFADMDFTAEAA